MALSGTTLKYGTDRAHSEGAPVNVDSDFT